MEDIDDVSLKEERRLGVDEVEGGGGAPPCDPVEGAFKVGVPRRGEHAERILVHRNPFFFVVFSVVSQHLLHAFMTVLLLQILHHDLQLQEPKFVEAGERSHGETLLGLGL